MEKMLSADRPVVEDALIFGVLYIDYYFLSTTSNSNRKQTEATGQVKQWVGVENMKICGPELWDMETFRGSFTIKAACDVLPSPKNLIQSDGEDPTSH